MEGKRWNRDEVLVAFNIYCRTPFGRLHARNPEIIRVAEALGRTPSALAMKCCNLAAFDPAQRARGIAGLSGGSKVDEQVWEDFARAPETVSFESEMQFATTVDEPVREDEEVKWEDVRGLDRDTVTRVRVNQHFFRSLILSGYNTRCAICSLPVPTLLVASHIVPWSIDSANRMNPRNGLCLCSLHDRAFDRGLLAVDSEYSIHISPRMDEFRDNEAAIQNILIFGGKKIHLPDRWHPDVTLLERHRDLVFE